MEENVYVTKEFILVFGFYTLVNLKNDERKFCYTNGMV